MTRFLKIILVLIISLPAALTAQNSSSHSVLSAGKWIRLAITGDGVYRLDYSKLKELGLTEPSKPRLYAYNQGQLSYYNHGPVSGDLNEQAVFISGNDSSLGEGEYLLFYGQSPHRWIFDSNTHAFSFLRHNYSDTAFYFITSGGEGRKIISTADNFLTANNISNTSDALYIHEKEIKNLLKSGREWFQPVPAAGSMTIDPGFTDIIPSEKIQYSIRLAARAAITTQFSLSENSALIKSIPIAAVNLSNYTGTYASISEYADSVLPKSSSPVYELKYSNNGTSSESAGWLDYITFHGRRNNRFSGTFMHLTDSRSVIAGGITEFRIESSAPDATIWDITDPENPAAIQYRKSGSELSFTAKTDSLRHYIIFSPGNVKSPVVNLTNVPNQDLHGTVSAEMLIVSHPAFLRYAQQLADFHSGEDNLSTLIVTPEQIYNEFSGGIRDIVAIRNFVRMKYLKQKNTAMPLRYLLLFGDGSFENRTGPPGNPNFIPTYQSQNSNVVVSTFTSDDFYGLLDENEGESEGTEDIGIGRLPVNDTSQAALIISKIRAYSDPINNGDWKNIICLAADDEDGNTHLTDTEILSKIIEDSVPVFNVSKIYLDAYSQSTSVSGQTYPGVNKAINDRINTGCLVFNYVGHGSENGLAHEGILAPADIKSWQNAGRLPLFITATCEFSRFDDAAFNDLTGAYDQKTSAGELALLGNKNGAIALMSTTRVVYSAPNAFLNSNIFKTAFSPDSSGKSLTFGDIIRIAKNNSGSGTNKRNFTLLGDPALRLAYPWHGRILTDSVNNLTEGEVSDTLKALSVITVHGHIEDNKGQISDKFNGIVSPVVFDKLSSVRTLANDGGSSVDFMIRNNILFSGKTRAVNGKFSFSFIVPRDIDYTPGKGKISYYASDTEADMQGYTNNIVVGGFASNTMNDTRGPSIKLYMNDTLFRDGGITSTNPKLMAVIEDQGGINTTGAGIGHDITAVLDNNPKNTVILNEYFENDFDNYSRGKLFYNLTSVPEGRHSLTLKAWDNFNNSSVSSLNFIVGNDGRFIIDNLINYPNPFSQQTTFEATHNRPDSELEVTVNIYNLRGQLIKSMHDRYYSSGFVIPPVIWDGRDDRGARAGQGVYPYTIKIKTPEGETATASGRLIIL